MAIIAAAAKIGATVKFITNEKQGQYGPYKSVLFIRGDRPQGTKEAEEWKTFKPHEAEQFRKGQRVNLIPVRRDDRDTFDIEILPDSQPQPQQTTQPTPVAATAPTVPPSQQSPTPPGNPQAFIAGQPKTAIAQYIGEMGDLYSHCYSVAIAKLPDGVDHCQVQAMASSLFIAAQRRFNLA